MSLTRITLAGVKADESSSKGANEEVITVVYGRDNGAVEVERSRLFGNVFGKHSR